MGIIRLHTTIKAPIERCFDLSRSIDAHLSSASATKERAVAGRTSGLIELGELVTWEAVHFGIKQKLTVKISEMERPHHFKDCQVQGPFKRFDHEHRFEQLGEFTIVKDIFDLECPYGIFGKIADPIVTAHLRKFLLERNRAIKELAEGEGWRAFL